jgi:hypothetical protein
LQYSIAGTKPGGLACEALERGDGTLVSQASVRRYASVGFENGAVSRHEGNVYGAAHGKGVDVVARHEYQHAIERIASVQSF